MQVGDAAIGFVCKRKTDVRALTWKLISESPRGVGRMWIKSGPNRLDWTTRRVVQWRDHGQARGTFEIAPTRLSPAARKKCQNGVFSGRLVSVVVGPSRKLSHECAAQHQILCAMSAGGVQLQAAAPGRGAHSPPARKHFARPYQKHQFGAHTSRACGLFAFSSLSITFPLFKLSPRFFPPQSNLFDCLFIGQCLPFLSPFYVSKKAT